MVNTTHLLHIVGIALDIGPYPDVQALSHSIYAGTPIVPTASPSVTASTQQRLLSVAERALSDASIDQGSRTAVIIICGNTIADTTLAHEIAASWQFSAPTQTIVASSPMLADALSTVQQWFALGKADAALIAAVDTLPDTEPAAVPHDRQPGNRFYAEGAAAVVVQAEHDSNRQRQSRYATIRSWYVGDQPASASTITADACRQALHIAGIAPSAIGYLEVVGHRESNQSELGGLIEAYARSDSDTTCAIGSLSTVTGDTSAVAGLASLVKTTLCLYQRFLPATPAWSGPSDAHACTHSPFSVPQESLPWFTHGQQPRHAALYLEDANRHPMHIILTEAAPPALRRRPPVSLDHLPLFLLTAADQPALLARLGTFQQMLETGRPLHAIARQLMVEWQQHQHAPYVLALVAHDYDELIREIERARIGIPQAFAEGSEWKTPTGSSFTANPLGPEGKVAFVYPGAFNAYIGLGQHLFRSFPYLYDHVLQIAAHRGSPMEALGIYPRSFAPLSSETLKSLEAHLVEDSIGMFEIGTIFARLYTIMMQDIFDIQPSMAFGYSQGETAMIFAMGVWPQNDEPSTALRASNLYTTRLSGPKQAAQALWGLTRDDTPDTDIWANYVLMASPEQVLPHLADEPRVYLAIINTPNEVMLAGDPQGCLRVIARVGCRRVKAPFHHIIHSPPVQSEYHEFVRINSFPVQPLPGIQFYSAAHYEPIELTTDSVAHSIARVCCQTLDFPRLVDRVYQDGARIFIELGPGRNCSRWIDAILDGRPYVSLYTNKKGVDDTLSIFRVLAKLLTHRVPLNLSALNGDALAVLPSQPTKIEQLPDSALPLAEQNGSIYQNGHDHTPYAAYQTLAGVPAYAARTASMPTREQVYAQQQEVLRQTTALATAAHQSFLDQRHHVYQQLHQMVQQSLQWPSSTGVTEDVPVLPPAAPDTIKTSRPSVINEQQVYAFTLGSVVDCFGPEFAIYEHRRLPRTPNGDLQLMHRVVAVEAQRHDYTPGASLVSEYDVPIDAWFYRQNAFPVVPYALLMEMALQPCGFLSAYLGSCLLLSQEDLYFRNLDGRGHLLRSADVRGKTITNQVRLISSTFIQGVIIQKFAFDMICDGQSFYQGDSVFGYFTLPALLNQVGLDNGKHIPPWALQQQHTHAPVTIDLRVAEARQRWYQAPPHRPHYRLASQQLDLLDQVQIFAGQGRYGQGYLYATRDIKPDDWFYTYHFFEDPVMPGSLGVEAIIQAMQLFALYTDAGRHFKSPRFEPLPDHTVTWRYRGQVPQESVTCHMEIHLKRVEYHPNRVILVGQASFWRGTLRIYEIEQVALQIVET
ncbi:MAG: PfaB family protein [Chloroflexaceae bacterium]|nr:PfaB family protein [Chloroflexaceae bacterium]